MDVDTQVNTLVDEVLPSILQQWGERSISHNWFEIKDFDSRLEQRFSDALFFALSQARPGMRVHVSMDGPKLTASILGRA